MLTVKNYAQDAAISRVFKSLFFKFRNHWVINLLEMSIEKHCLLIISVSKSFLKIFVWKKSTSFFFVYITYYVPLLNKFIMLEFITKYKISDKMEEWSYFVTWRFWNYSIIIKQL